MYAFREVHCSHLLKVHSSSYVCSSFRGVHCAEVLFASSKSYFTLDIQAHVFAWVFLSLIVLWSRPPNPDFRILILRIPGMLHSSLYVFTSSCLSRLLVFTSSCLHVFRPSRLHAFISSRLYLFASSRLRVLALSHLLASFVKLRFIRFHFHRCRLRVFYSSCVLALVLRIHD